MMKTITKIKYDEGFRWPPFDNLHATTNQKHAGMMEGGWDRPRDRTRTLGEHDGNNKPLAEGNEDDNNEYGKDADIPDDDDEYAVGVNGVCVFLASSYGWVTVMHEIPIFSAQPLTSLPYHRTQ